ncbi:MAG: oligosaccharide flippase family protein [Elusimicrobia bacterium]|nr:oligosaccharide flippase family protein [Candidatus Liberimonas magnetica]
MDNNQNNINLKRLAAKGAGMLFFRHLFSFLINFGGGIVLARFFGPEVMGLYFISYTVFIVIRELLEWGLRIFFIQAQQEPSQQDLNAAFTLQNVIALVIIVLAVIFAGPIFVLIYKNKIIYPLIISAAVGGYLYSLNRIPLALLERKMSYENVSIVELLEIVAFNTIAVSMVFIQKGSGGLVVGNVFRGLLPLLYLVLLKNMHFTFSFDFTRIKEIFNKAMPIVSANFTSWLIILAPPLIVGSFAGSAALGIAQQALMLVSQASVLSTILNRVFMSFLSRMQNDMLSFNNYVNKLLESLSMIYVVLILGTASFSSWWAPLLYGKKWVGLDDIIILTALPVTQSAILMTLMSALYSLGKANVIFKQTLVQALAYWAAMGIFVIMGLKQFALPLAYLIAIQSGIILFVYYIRNYGKLVWFSVGFNLFSGYLIAVCVWFLTKNGHILYAISLWIIFLSFSYFRLKEVRQTFINLKSIVLST